MPHIICVGAIYMDTILEYVSHSKSVQTSYS
jgi:hypothetical protein